MNSNQVEKFALIKVAVFVFFFLTSFSLISQDCPEVGDDLGNSLAIMALPYNGIENHYQFEVCGKPQLPEIDALAEYKYFWDFGDGTYSFEDKPYHEYLTDGTFSAKVHLVKAYTSPIKGLTLRTAQSSNGGTLTITTVGTDPTAEYDPNDGYKPPTISEGNIDMQTAFDLVPGYLQTFILSLENTCGTPGTKEVIFTYPKGMFAHEGATFFANPDNPAETVQAEVPNNNPPESIHAVYPIHSAEPNLRFRNGHSPGIPDTILFNIEFLDGSVDPQHVFLNLYVSPFLPLDQDAIFNVFLAACGNLRVSGSDDESNHLEKRVPPKSSHDPNYKYVDDISPADKSKLFISGSGPNKLVFRLAFQNEGSIPVRDVLVNDTLAKELDFNTIKLLGISLADTNTPQSICDYPPFYRDYKWESLSDPTHYYEMTKDPVTRVISWKFKTSLSGAEMEYNGALVPDEWTWGYIDFEVYTKCGLDEKASFTNHAGVFFEDQEAVLTNEVAIRRLCYNDKEFVYAGPGYDLNLDRIAQRYYPNVQFDPKSVIITGSRAGIKYPTYIDPTRGGEFRYEPDKQKLLLLESLRSNNTIKGQTRETVYVDNLRYTICAQGGKNCYPVSIFVLINPNIKASIPAYECDGECVSAPPVKDPYPRWWYYAAGLILLLLLLILRIRKRRRR